MTMLNDAHCHFFSSSFFEALGRQLNPSQPVPVTSVVERLGWDHPGNDEELADRWIAELDRFKVGRAALIASAPGDEPAVQAALERHPARVVGFFMVDPTLPDAVARVRSGLQNGFSAVCLFPAMHRFTIDGDAAGRVFEAVSKFPGKAVFVHCGRLSLGVRAKLGLFNSFDARLGNPLDLHPLATRYPQVPVIIPHFGAGFLREALMLADAHENIHLDTSSSNSWLKFHPGLSFKDVFVHSLLSLGPERILFGTDSSFFPRGWQEKIFKVQQDMLEQLRLEPKWKNLILGGNFNRLFPVTE